MGGDLTLQHPELGAKLGALLPGGPGILAYHIPQSRVCKWLLNLQGPEGCRFQLHLRIWENAAESGLPPLKVLQSGKTS